MYSKIIYELLKQIRAFFYKMTNKTNEDTQVQNGNYAFKPFVYHSMNHKFVTRVPFPRSGHRIGADSANLYSFGGYNPALRMEDLDSDDGFLESYPLFQELWRYNFAKKRWFRFPNSQSLPMELASNALILHKNVLMVYGGTGSPFGHTCSNQLYVCRINEDDGMMLEIDTTGQLPLPAYGQAIVYHNDYLYTIGGTTGLSYTCDIHRLNLTSLVWEVVYVGQGLCEYEPQGRYRHEVGCDNNNIYILGGGTASAAFGFKVIPTFNLQKQVWLPLRTSRDPLKGYPKARRCHGAVQVTIGSEVYVFIVGGHDGRNMFDDLWSLNLNSLQWRCFDRCRLPSPMYFHAAAVSPEGKLFIFGGICATTDDESERSNKMFSTWLCVPKLSEISWEAMLHYSPHISECDSKDLMNIGLPKHFVQRLGNHESNLALKQ